MSEAENDAQDSTSSSASYLTCCLLSDMLTLCYSCRKFTKSSGLGVVLFRDPVLPVYGAPVASEYTAISGERRQS